MNYINIQNNMHNKIKSYRTEYQKGNLTSQEMSNKAKRVGSIMSKARMLDTHFRKREKKISDIERRLNILKDTLQENPNTKIVSIDTGFDNETMELHEVGIAIVEGENITLKRFIVNGFQDKAKESINPDAEERVMSLIQIFFEVQKLYDEADLAVFHQPYYDVKLLNLDTGSHRFFNTADLSNYWYYVENASLETLAKRYNIEFNHPHDSAEDALVTYKVLIAMMNDDAPYDLAPIQKNR